MQAELINEQERETSSSLQVVAQATFQRESIGVFFSNILGVRLKDMVGRGI